MTTVRRLSILLLLLLSIALAAQNTAVLEGQIMDGELNEPLLAATVQTGETGAITDLEGYYRVELSPGTYVVEFSFIGYEPLSETITLTAGETREINITLFPTANLLNTATVTSGKFEKPLGEVSVSLQVLKPDLLETTNQTSLDGFVDKVPGVNVVDGQANIRGGSGYSYGAGSRVLLLVDDLPILSPDAGSSSWNDIPIENIAQVEVVKGAASALYGSSALNGIINVRTAYAKSEPETQLSSFVTIYDGPQNDTLNWWDDEDPERSPLASGLSVAHRRKMGKTDLVLGGYGLYINEPIRDVYNRYGRLNAKVRHRINDKLSVGLTANVNRGLRNNYFFWAGLDSLYTGRFNTVSRTERTRFNIDPFVTYFDGSGNRHKLLGRIYTIDNQASNNQSNGSTLYYGEYQFQRNFEPIELVLTAGAVTQGTNVQAELYGDTLYTSRNAAAYLQLDKKFFDRLNLSAGLRYEYNLQRSPDVVGGVAIEEGRVTDARPVFRFGANYQAAEFTFLRASWGQGYRFPTVAERFVQTNFGGTRIFPNPLLRPETGYSMEVGLRQGFRVGKFQGFLDASAFQMEYDDMIEFVFDPTSFGFQSQNVGDTDIRGLEFSVNGQGAIGKVPITLLTGYTYIDPKFDEFDTTPIENFNDATRGQLNATYSSSSENILKYRFRHTIKFDLGATFGKVSLGVSHNYNSNMEAVDEIFQALVVPGLRQFRERHPDGTHLLGARIGFQVTEALKLSLLGSNLLNEEYAIRPGLMGHTRNYSARVDWKF